MQEETSTTNLMTFASMEDQINYLDKKYSDRFTSEDAIFVEHLQRPPIDPPIIKNYTGRIYRRPYRRYDNNHRNNERRYN